MSEVKALRTEKASCFCGNINATMALSQPLSTFIPRACDCSFCVKHGAAFISDPGGKLKLTVESTAQLTKYQHGHGVAEFLVCGKCGVFVAVACRHDGKVFASMNAATIDGDINLSEVLSVSPKLLSETEKIQRWTQGWFSSVIIETPKN